MKKKLSSILVVLTLISIAFLICMKSPNNIFSNTSSPYTDSSVFKYIGLSMTKGYIPYLDFFDHKGLLLYFINYLGTLISTNIGVWIIEFAFMIASVSFAYKLARKFTSKLTSLFIIGIAFSQIYDYFEGGNLTEEYALLFQLIALNIFFDFFLNPKKYSSEQLNEKTSIFRLNFKLFNFPVFICGICCAAVIFLRANMISVWIAFGLMVLVYCIAHKKYIEMAKFAISFFTGIMFITIPMIIYLMKNGAFESFINCYILFNMQYSSECENIAKLETLKIFLNTTVTTLAFIIVAIKTYIQIKKKEQYYFNLGYLFYMVITLILISMSGVYNGHYGMTLIPTLIYPYCILYQFLEKKELKNAGINLIVTGYLLYLIIVPTTLNFSTDCLKNIVNRDVKKIYEPEVIDYIISNTEENDLISVFGNTNSIYYLTNRQSASRYSYQTPIGSINKQIMHEYFNDLRENKPKLVIWSIGDGCIEMKQMMLEFLGENNYKLVKDGTARIYAMDGE